MPYLNPIVAKVSPNLYSAVKGAGLSSAESTQVEQMSYTIDQHRQLTKLDPEKARQRYDSLDPNIQGQLKFMFKNADYLQPPKTATDAVTGVLKTVGTAIASPLIGLFKVAGAYNKIINEPYKVFREVQQGANLFSTHTWTDAWDGKNLYDNKALKEATDAYGKYDVVVAQGLLEGKTPGEIIQGYGKVDEGMLKSLTRALDKPEEFNSILQNVKMAQISPGRDLVRILDRGRTANGGPLGDHVNGFTKFMSGAVDFAYQLAIDPLTWMTGGLSGGASKGERLANSIKQAMNNGADMRVAIGDAFKDPKLYNLWEKQLGPVLKEYSQAEEKSSVMSKIARDFPGYNNPEAIKSLTAKSVHLPDGVVDAESAKKYFEQGTNLHLLLSGRVDGISYMRNGVAIARTSRLMSDGFVRFLDRTFNAVESTGAERAAAIAPIYEDLLKSEDMVQTLKNGLSPAITDANAQIKMWKDGKFNPKFIGQMASRSPAGLEVRTGEDAIKTAGNFTARARQLLPRDMAEALTYKFVDATADEQFLILRNLDAATMYSMGLGGSERGEDLIRVILEEKYGDKAGFATKVELAVNPEHAKDMPAGLIKDTETGIIADSEGPIHSYQATRAVGSLPYTRIGEMVWDIKSKKNAIGMVGGATQGAFAKQVVNAWSMLTLLPRLGIRSSIDEATMYVLTAPARDVMAFVTRQGNKFGNMSRAFTGSIESTGPVKQVVQKLFQIGNKERTEVSFGGKRIVISPEDALSLVKREELLQDKAKELGTDVGLLSSLQKREAVADHIQKLYGGYVNEKDAVLLMQAWKHSPDALNSMAASLVAHSAISGKWGEEVAASMIDPSMLDRALESIGVKMRNGKRIISTDSLTNQEIALAQYEKLYKQFVGNKFKVDGETILNPAEIFFKYGGLRPGEKMLDGTTSTMRGAINYGMEKIGFKKNSATGMWVIDNPITVNRFLEQSSFNARKVQQGAIRADIAEQQIARQLVDMYETFHGDSNKFNETLFNLVESNMSKLRRSSDYQNFYPTYNQAIAMIPLDVFTDASSGYRIAGKINTEIAFGDFDAENVIARFGQDAMNMMDRQVTGIFRQPAVMITYVKLRKEYAGFEREFANNLYMERAGKWELPTARFSNEKVMAECKAVAEKRFTELATREAADTVLKFADNPSIRSNFAFSGRTVGRYYRATEDFYRRIYRMKEVTPRALYRIRLAHVGLDASGMFHKDQNGEPYLVMPMDNVLFRATDSAMRTITGKGGYGQPLFNDFTLKLRMMNPSFQQDAGLPTLSGPIAGLSVVAFKDILGTVPGNIPFIGKYIGGPSKQLAEGIDTFALGNVGDNVDVVKATVPASLQRLWAIIDPTEKSRQEATAAQQAIAYNASQGIHLNPNATDQEKSDYLKNIRITAHNVIALRNFLGLISPVTPTTMESKGVPNYVKDTGITSMRSEFFDILNGITAKNNGDIQDPYELALATYTGKHPGKLIYTVSREDKQTRVLIKNTDALKGWALGNEKLINTYGEAAYIFAPQAGKFNAATYNFIQAAGLVKSKSLESYYNDLMVAQDKQSYYDIARIEKEQLNTVSDQMARANIINEATSARASLVAANPLLKPALIGQGNNIGKEGIMLNSVEQIINDPSTPVAPETRKRMAIAVKLIRDFVSMSTDPALKNLSDGGVGIKAERRQQIEAALNDLSLGDLYVTEANRAIFKSMLSFYSRDSYYTFKAIK